MLSSVVLAVLAVTVIATSFLSGIFGMAGGMILLGVLLVFLDVAPLWCFSAPLRLPPMAGAWCYGGVMCNGASSAGM
jgi:uncharacterized membrane protein YfcA